MNIVRLWVLVWLGAMLAGCGQKGPLVQPDAPKHKKVTRSAPAAPAPAPGAPETGAVTDPGTPPGGSRPGSPTPPPGGAPDPTPKP